MKKVNKEIKSFIIKTRKKINKILRDNNFNYQYNALISQAYCGEGFYINHRKNVINEPIIYAYDKRWAYGGALIYKKFPMNCEFTTEETELGIYAISFSYMKPRYPEFYYTLYRNNVMMTTKHFNTIFITNIDWPIFNDLWITDAKIIKKQYFKNISELPEEFKDMVREAYIDKKKDENKELKKYFESCYYGMFAKKLKKDSYSNMTEELKYIDAYAQTGYEDIRCEQTPIAMFQAAYLRYEEWQLFKANKDDTIYMNTDSWYGKKSLDVIDKGLGYYRFEFNKKVLFIRRNAYIVLNEDDTVYKSVVGGCIDKKDDFTPDKINDLREGKSIICKTKNKDEELIDIELRPLFLHEYLGLTIVK